MRQEYNFAALGLSRRHKRLQSLVREIGRSHSHRAVTSCIVYANRAHGKTGTPEETDGKGKGR